MNAAERERDEFDRTQAAILRHDQLLARATAAEARVADHEAQIRDLLEEREELLTVIVRLRETAADVREAERTAEHWEGLWTVAIERAEAAEAQVTEKAAEIRRLRMGNHPAGRALPHLALAEALTERDAEHEGGAS